MAEETRKTNFWDFAKARPVTTIIVVNLIVDGILKFFKTPLD